MQPGKKDLLFSLDCKKDIQLKVSTFYFDRGSCWPELIQMN